MCKTQRGHSCYSSESLVEAQVDAAFLGTDREAVEMAAHLLHRDGLFLGSSAAMNCVGAVKARSALLACWVGGAWCCADHSTPQCPCPNLARQGQLFAGIILGGGQIQLYLTSCVYNFAIVDSIGLMCLSLW